MLYELEREMNAPLLSLLSANEKWRLSRNYDLCWEQSRDPSLPTKRSEIDGNLHDAWRQLCHVAQWVHGKSGETFKCQLLNFLLSQLENNQFIYWLVLVGGKRVVLFIPNSKRISFFSWVVFNRFIHILYQIIGIWYLKIWSLLSWRIHRCTASKMNKDEKYSNIKENSMSFQSIDARNYLIFEVCFLTI